MIAKCLLYFLALFAYFADESFLISLNPRAEFPVGLGLCPQNIVTAQFFLFDKTEDKESTEYAKAYLQQARIFRLFRSRTPASPTFREGRREGQTVEGSLFLDTPQLKVPICMCMYFYFFLSVMFWSRLFMCIGSVLEDRYVDKTSAVLNKWYVELTKCVSEDHKIKTGCGECLVIHICSF